MKAAGFQVCLTAMAATLVILSAPSLAADRTPIDSMTTEDLENGERLFRVHCGRCHGMLGEGGEGPSLKRPILVHAPDDERLFLVINNGIPGTGMPSTFAPNNTELWQIAAYVRALGQLPEEEPPGDPVRGKEIFETKGACSTCHITDGVGRGVGPELTTVGLRRNLEYLRRSMTHPDADYPMTQDRITGRINAFLTVNIVSPDGEFEGMRVNEDEFSVQMRDLNGDIHSFEKRDLLSYERAFGHSLMPGYRAVLTPTEIDDVVSYLMMQKGDQ